MAKVYQFKVSLMGIRPMIWRRIQVPENYSFWELHIAIQDAMGWEDYHLYEFTVFDPQNWGEARIGEPSDDGPMWGPKTQASWGKKIRKYFPNEGVCCYYHYDFGDDWKHKVRLEKILPVAPGKSYPICIAGKRACPPEDCGGVWGYENLVEIIRDPKHEEYENRMEWVGRNFDPEMFDPQAICFRKPKKHQ